MPALGSQGEDFMHGMHGCMLAANSSVRNNNEYASAQEPKVHVCQEIQICQVAAYSSPERHAAWAAPWRKH
jgi:hypothetical protein